jgi:hypothetical protein
MSHLESNTEAILDVLFEYHQSYFEPEDIADMALRDREMTEQEVMEAAEHALINTQY